MFHSTLKTTAQGGETSISALHSDIISTHLLTRLDGPSLASISCASSQLHSLSNPDALWTDICLSTWPSVDNPRMRRFLSEFPAGPRAFFSNSFPLLISQDPPHPPNPSSPTNELISAVDIYHKGNPIFSKVQETETDSAWFRCSPFRIDLLDPKDAVPTSMNSMNCSSYLQDLLEELSLSWIIANPVRRQAANLSSWRPVSVQRHWLTNDVQVRFATILGVGNGAEVQCGIMVVLGREMQVKEVSLQVEDMEGVSLNGKESLGILERGIEGGERRKGRRGEGRERYEEYVRRGRERREKKVRREGRLDAFCVAVGVSILASFWMLILS